MDSILEALISLSTWQTASAVLLGSFVGLVFGAIPGLTFTMILAMVLPLTFAMEPIPAIALLLATYIGGASGGTVSAILIGVPGTPSAAATVLDGYVLARSGKASLTLATATIVSSIGGIISLAIMLISVEVLARIALAFGPAEITALVVFGLSTICGLAERSLIRGLIGGVIGLMVMTIGLDPLDATQRFTFGTVTLLQGVDLLVAMIGLFAVPQAVEALINWRRDGKWEVDSSKVRVELPSLLMLFSEWWNILRSSLIGTAIGAIPGTGGPIAAFLAYDQARRFSKHPERFGKGEMAGVIAPETANNAVTGGSMIPLLGLGIPADAATAILLGGLLIHGIQPGPLLFTEKPVIISSIYILFALAYVIVTTMQLFGIRLFVHILRVPQHLLAMGILVMCTVGSFSIRNSFFDVASMMVVGFFGYFMLRARIPVAPVLLGLVLGPILEREFRTAMVMSEGDLSIFYSSVPSVLFFGLAILIIVLQTVSSFRARAVASQQV